MPAKQDLTGQRFGRLVVIGAAPNIGSRTMWLCICDCGTTKIVSSNSMKRGDTKSCGCLFKEGLALKARLMNDALRQFSPREAAARNTWRNGRYGEMPFDDFYQLSQLACFYCAKPPSNVMRLSASLKYSPETIAESTFIYSGLDRIDSTKPHLLDNVIPSCLNCNSAKREQTIWEFLNQVDRLTSRAWIDPITYRKQALLIDTGILDHEDMYAFRSSVRGRFRAEYNDEDLTEQQFYQLTQLDCYYCGLPPSNRSTAGVTKNSSDYAKATCVFIYSGLDRISCALPHNYDNVVPACKWCNYGKLEMSMKEFGDWVVRLKCNEPRKKLGSFASKTD